MMMMMNLIMDIMEVVFQVIIMGRNELLYYYFIIYYLFYFIFKILDILIIDVLLVLGNKLIQDIVITLGLKIEVILLPIIQCLSRGIEFFSPQVLYILPM